MDTNDILRASLFGSKIIKEVPKFEQIENRIGKHVLPVLNVKGEIVKLFDKRKDEWITNVTDDENRKFRTTGLGWEDEPRIDENKQFFPFSVSKDEGATWFLLPYEPMISIEGKNNIITRNVLKYNESYSGMTYGTVKERWSTDDYKITITGILVGKEMLDKQNEAFPKKDFEELKSYLLHGKELKVKCEPLELLGINDVVIESFSFPFTKGENVQAYTITALSDVKTELIVKPKNS